MILEWAALSKTVLSAVTKLVAERARKLGGDASGEQLSRIYKRIMRKDLLSKVNQIFVSRFSEELDRAADLPTLTMESYLVGLKHFLSNGPVQDLLQAPLDGREVPSHFIHGCFNNLADLMRLGWHPDYKSLLDGSD